jgi:hypothetical protein
MNRACEDFVLNQQATKSPMMTESPRGDSAWRLSRSTLFA